MPRRPMLIDIQQNKSGMGSLLDGVTQGVLHGLIQQGEEDRRANLRAQIYRDQLARDQANFDRQRSASAEDYQRARTDKLADHATAREDAATDYQRNRADKVWDSVDAAEQHAADRAATQAARDKELGREMARDQETFNYRATELDRQVAKDKSASENMMGDNKRADAAAAEAARHNRAMESGVQGREADAEGRRKLEMQLAQHDREISDIDKQIERRHQNFQTYEKAGNTSEATFEWNQMQSLIQAKGKKIRDRARVVGSAKVNPAGPERRANERTNSHSETDPFLDALGGP